MYRQRLCFFVMVFMCWGGVLNSSTPQKAQLGDFKDWSMGKLEGLSLNAREGLTLAPQLRRLAQDFPGPILDAVLAENGHVFFATPSPARIWQFDGVNEPKKILELDRPLVTRLSMNGSKELVALSGPEGGVHFIPIKKPWQARFVPVKEAQMLMDLAVTPFGLFVVGGGDEGGLWEIKDKKKVSRIATFEDDMLVLAREWPGKRETLVLGTLSSGRVYKYVNGTLTALSVLGPSLKRRVAVPNVTNKPTAWRKGIRRNLRDMLKLFVSALT
jgi:hypothetical protein